jgi:hypothetical protein
MCVDCGNNSCSGNCNVIPKGLRGPRGYKGDTGATGPKGDRGITGSQGPQGSPGIPGMPGTSGGSGTIGPQGPTGPTGPGGLPGANGINGTNGMPGVKGDTGERGEKGETGNDGSSVTSTPNSGLGSCGGYDIKTLKYDGSLLANNPLYNGCNGKSGRGVATFVQATQPTNAQVASLYAGINGFSAPDYIVSGSYNASNLRAGDIWIKP